MDYNPEPVPGDLKDLPRYLFNELQNLASALINAPARSLEFRDVAPPKPREGMIYGADGTNWNPGGTGKGVYVYYGGAWHKL